MDPVTEKRKESVTKTLAIVGFLAIIVLIVFLSVKVVGLIPSAFSSLASIANTVYNPNDEALIASTKDGVVNAGESFTISWTDLGLSGSYRFMFECTDGVAVEAKLNSSDIVSVACGTELGLGSKTSLELLASSEKQRFTDISYTISFVTDEEESKTLSTNNVVTIVNASIPTSAQADDDEDEPEGEVAGEETTDDEEEAETETTTTYTPQTPTTIWSTVRELPVSDPNGVTDLRVRHLGVGTLSGTTFTPLAELDVDRKGAIQFEVKNIGTKTSNAWDFVAELPSDITYQSQTQLPLKPNERAIITIGFEGIGNTGMERFGVTIDAPGDINSSNDSYSWSVEVVD